ncbi:hypothetical protein GCM10007421_09600 [Halopseudomonas oceani]|uniref:Uncharacterized protein n=1 Tax=Halopseudomonas oceani TaxID=1708783 RepID=A0A2P4EXI5_9GAMM|nr:hypothetical protein [Halopseudomonas oceani]POB04728.1 hypothetical protein C1949_07115 [Halopseudomonas oceani]GGE37864.1 hypothetical protein GCM10007421_09600 [Halopseudomonas oceani]
MKAWILVGLALFSAPVLAGKEAGKPFLEQIFVAAFPLVIFLVVFWLIMRAMTFKNGKNINTQLLESNLEIAKELKRIADYVETLKTKDKDD